MAANDDNAATDRALTDHRAGERVRFNDADYRSDDKPFKSWIETEPYGETERRERLPLVRANVAIAVSIGAIIASVLGLILGIYLLTK